MATDHDDQTSLRIEGAKLTYTVDSGVVAWTLPIAAIVLIAEFTTNEGPYVDDYVLTFVTVENRKALDATCSFYAEGRDSALSEISHQVGCPIEVGLAVPFAIQPWRG